MANPERKVYRHPSSISLFNLSDKLNFPNVRGKTVLDLIKEKDVFFEWALISSKMFCFDDYTYSYIKEIGFALSETAHQKQIEKRETFKNDTINFNDKYKDDIKLDINTKDRIKLYKLSYHVGFGQYTDKTIEELIELSPSRMEFYIHTFPWFGLTTSAIAKLKSIEPKFIFLKSTFDLLKIKYDLAPDMMKGRRKTSTDYYNDDYNYSHNEPYMIGDPRYDRNENPWIDVFGEGDEAEAAYWNTD